MTTPFEQALETNVGPGCWWAVTIYNCPESQNMVATFYAAVACSLLAALLASLTLWHKLFKPHEANRRDDPIKITLRKAFSRLWGEYGMFKPTEGFIFFQVVWGIINSFQKTYFLLDIAPDNYIPRDFLFSLTYDPFFLGILTYLVGIIRAVPRVQWTPGSGGRRAVFYIPQAQYITPIYWVIFISYELLGFSISIVLGHARNLGDLPGVMFWHQFMQFSHSVYLFGLLCGFLYYGRQLMVITSATFKLLYDSGKSHAAPVRMPNAFSKDTQHRILTNVEENDEEANIPAALNDAQTGRGNVDSVMGVDRDKVRTLRKTLKKLKIFNYGCSIAMAYYVYSLVSWGIGISNELKDPPKNFIHMLIGVIVLSLLSYSCSIFSLLEELNPYNALRAVDLTAQITKIVGEPLPQGRTRAGQVTMSVKTGPANVISEQAAASVQIPMMAVSHDA